jgi:purine-binding chemotaxis protein CheW
LSADASPAEVAGIGDAYLTLRALDQTFALAIEFARSIFEIETLTRVPMAPRHLVGLSHFRGGIVGIVCLARRLDPNAHALGVGALGIAIELGAETVALAVQDVGDVIFAHSEGILPTNNPADPRNALMAGVIRLGTRLLPVLDPFSIFEIRSVAEAP